MQAPKAASKRKEVTSKLFFHCFLFYIFKILTMLRKVRQSKMQNNYPIKPRWILQTRWTEDVRRKYHTQEPPLPDVLREEKVILPSKIPLVFLIFCSSHSFPYKLPGCFSVLAQAPHFTRENDKVKSRSSPGWHDRLRDWIFNTLRSIVLVIKISPGGLQWRLQVSSKNPASPVLKQKPSFQMTTFITTQLDMGMGW